MAKIRAISMLAQCCLAFAIMAGRSIAGVPEQITLAQPGRSEIVSFDTDVREAFPDSDCVRVEGIGGTRLKITAIKEGICRIDYRLRGDETKRILTVQVGTQPDNPVDMLAAWLTKELEPIVGVEVSKDVGLNQVTVSGTIRLKRDRDRLLNILDNAPKLGNVKIYRGFTIVVEEAVIKSEFEKVLSTAGILNGAVEISHDLQAITVRGECYTEKQQADVAGALKQRAKDLMLGEVTITMALTAKKSTFDVEITYFELIDEDGDSFGADLLNNVGVNLSGGMSTGSGMRPDYSFNANVNIGKVLEHFIDKGNVATLKRFTVTTQNGKEGEIMMGKNIKSPIIRETGASASSMESSDVGDLLRATVSYLNASQVLLDLEGEVSVIDKIDDNGYIQSNQKRFKTSFEMPVNGQMPLGVNKTKHKVKRVTGTPYARNIPLLGWLFRTEKMMAADAFAGFVVVVRETQAGQAQGPSVTDRTVDVIKQVESSLGAK